MSAGIRDLNGQLSTNYTALLNFMGHRLRCECPRTTRRNRPSRRAVADGGIAGQNARPELPGRARHQRPIDRTTREVTRMMIVGMAIVMALSGFTFYQVSRSILRPIQSLTGRPGSWGPDIPPSRCPSRRAMNSASWPCHSTPWPRNSRNTARKPPRKSSGSTARPNPPSPRSQTPFSS